jgi:hypothetical protein
LLTVIVKAKGAEDEEEENFDDYEEEKNAEDDEEDKGENYGGLDMESDSQMT